MQVTDQVDAIRRAEGRIRRPGAPSARYQCSEKFFGSISVPIVFRNTGLLGLAAPAMLLRIPVGHVPLLLCR